jgi:hypothetical protein
VPGTPPESDQTHANDSMKLKSTFPFKAPENDEKPWIFTLLRW